MKAKDIPCIKCGGLPEMNTDFGVSTGIVSCIDCGEETLYWADHIKAWTNWKNINTKKVRR